LFARHIWLKNRGRRHPLGLRGDGESIGSEDGKEVLKKARKLDVMGGKTYGCTVRSKNGVRKLSLKGNTSVGGTGRKRMDP